MGLTGIDCGDNERRTIRDVVASVIRTRKTQMLRPNLSRLLLRLRP